jgi:hypothetical protein
MVHRIQKSKPLAPAPTANEALLNEALGLAMEWGENWLMHIQARLGHLHPDLSSGELNEVNEICQAAMRFGHQTVNALARPKGTGGYPSLADFEVAFRARYPWANEANVSMLFSQSMYYAMK